jgi:hypothetical protein
VSAGVRLGAARIVVARIVAACVLCAAIAAPAPAQRAPVSPEPHDAHAAHGVGVATSAAPDDAVRAAFAARAAEGTVAFRDRRAAVAAGYRRLGLDFPAMGEHWVNPGLVIAGRFDVARPAMLSYVRVRGEPVLVGVVYAVPLAPGEPPPSIPGDPALWHEHNGTIDEETVVPSHGADRGAGHAAHDARVGGTRLAILHAWTAAPNPAGLFVSDNWTLPFVRLGLAVPAPVDPLAARALSLASGGEPYWLALVANGAPLAPATEAAVRGALRTGRATAGSIATRPRPGASLSPAEIAELRAAWLHVVERVAAIAGDAAAGRLRGEG